MTVAYLFSGLLGHLPLLAVLIAGFVVVATRSARMGARSVLLARLGMGALALGSILGATWTMLVPVLYSRVGYSPARYGLLFSGFGVFTALLTAAGVALLIAAVVSRQGGPAFADGPPPHQSGQPTGPPSHY
jgi:hypothetical protein